MEVKDLNPTDSIGAQIGDEDIPDAPVGDPDPQPAWLRWLKTPTGPGGLEEYVDHPLNPGQSRGLAQVLRGVTGFTEDLGLAVLDIVIGLARFVAQEGGGTREDTARGGPGEDPVG